MVSVELDILDIGHSPVTISTTLSLFAPTAFADENREVDTLANHQAASSTSQPDNPNQKPFVLPWPFSRLQRQYVQGVKARI
jgi:hypothetical protein